MTSTGYLRLMAAALAAGCGGNGSDGGGEEPCEVRLLEPCPECGSGEVLHAVEGEDRIAPRPGGGYVGVGCGDSVFWHDRDFSIARSANLAFEEEGWLVLNLAVGDADEVYYVAQNQVSYDYKIGAVDADGERLWRVPAPDDMLGSASLVAAGVTLYSLSRRYVASEDDEWVTPWLVLRLAKGNGELAFEWSSPFWDISEDSDLPMAAVVPREAGGARLVASLHGIWQLEGGPALEPTEDFAAVAVDIDADGMARDAHVVVEEPGVRFSNALPDADGRITLAGVYGPDAAAFGDGVRLPLPPSADTSFVLDIRADGTAAWATTLDASPDFVSSVSRMARIGDQLLVAGQRREPDGLEQHGAFVAALSGGSVDWRIDAGEGPSQRTHGPVATADGTFLFALSVDGSDEDPTEPVLDFAGIRLQGPTSVVVELAP